MNRLSALHFLFLLGVLLPRPCFAQTGLAPYLEQVREEMDGQRAFQTTAFVEQFWRVPGNTGFDTTVHYVTQLLEKAGFVPEGTGREGQPFYRIERYPMNRLTWDPIDARLQILGQDTALLNYQARRHMITINSFSTPPGGLEAEVVYLEGCEEADFQGKDLTGKIVMADCHCYPLFKTAVEKYGAIGIMGYSIPSYNQPEKYIHSIPFTAIPYNPEKRAFGINLSTAARRTLLAALKQGPVRVKVDIDTRLYPSEELTLIAEIPGTALAEERFVFSAHIQEPGANDNASGVAVQAEMARVAAHLWQAEQVRPARTLTFLWGDEIRSTRRYITQDPKRAKDIRWGMSLDMVGEDTEKTDGTFLIEKMPDPSAIWTRGADKHTEWGASPVDRASFQPHYFNDFIEYVCRLQGEHGNWTVNTNPFEGGSDHQPFLDARIPGLLLWHFTDAFYHTDADRIDKVSATTLYHVGVSALSSALFLAHGGQDHAREVVAITQAAARRRLEAEYALSRTAVRKGNKPQDEQEILQAWTDWYTQAIPTAKDLLLKPDAALDPSLTAAAESIRQLGTKYIQAIGR